MELDKDKLNELRGLSAGLNNHVNDQLAWYDYPIDIFKGITAGAVDAVDETLQFGKDIADAAIEGTGYVLGQDWEGFDDADSRIMFETWRPTTGIGQFSEDLSQFGTGFLAGGVYLKGAKSIYGVGKAAQKISNSRIASSATKSLLSSTTAHDPYAKRLSDVIQDSPLANPVTDYLQADDDDTLAERRFKMALEDLATTGVAESIFYLAKGIRRKKKGEDPAVVDAETDAALEQAAEKSQKEAATKTAAKSEKIKAAKAEKQAVDEAAQKGEPIEDMPIENMSEVAAKDIEAKAIKENKSIQEVVDDMDKDDLVTVAHHLGVKVARGTKVGDTRTQNSLRSKVFDKISEKVADIKVEVPKGKKGKKGSGINRPNVKKTLVNETVIAAQIKAFKNPTDIKELFDDRKGGFSFLQERKGGIHSTLDDYTTEMNEAVESVVQTVKKGGFLEKTRGQQSWEDLGDEIATRLADTTGMTADDWLKNAYAFGKGVEEATIRLGVVEAHIKDSHKKLFELASHPKYKTNPKIREDLAVEMQHHNKLLAAAQMLETPMGRALNARKMSIKSTEDALKRARELNEGMRELGGTKQIDKVRELITMSGGDATKFGKAVAAMTPSLARKIGASAGELFRSMILLNLKTFWTNFGSGVAESVITPLERFVGNNIALALSKVGVGQMSGAVYKQDMARLTGHVAGLTYSAREALNIAGKAFYHEKNFLDPLATKLDGGIDTQAKISADYWGINPNNMAGRFLDTIGKTSRLSLRTLGAQDEFIKQINYRAAIIGEVFAEASAAGIKRNTTQFKELLKKRMDEAFDQNGRAINEDGLHQAREITFTEELKDGSVALWLQRGTQKFPAFQLILPFVRTPTNLIVRATQRTPVLGLLSQRTRKALSGELGPEQQALAMGRWAVGGTILLTAWSYLAEGKITGSGPALPKEQKLWRAAGNQPYSIRVGDKWYSYNRGDPLFMPIGALANLYDNVKFSPVSQDGNFAENALEFASALTLATTKTIENKAYFQGITQLLNVLNTANPMAEQQLVRTLENFATSFVPAIGQQTQDILSYYTGGENEYPELREAVGLVDKFIRKVPFYNEQLPKKYNFLTGEAIVNPDPLSTGIPVVPDKTVEKVGAELVELGYGFSGPPRKIEGVELTTEQYSDYNRLMGSVEIGGMKLVDALSKVMDKPWYRKNDPTRVYDGDVVAGDDVEIRAFQKIFEHYRKYARIELYKLHPQLMEEVKQRKIIKKYGSQLLEQNR